MSVIKKPDLKIFAQDAKTGKLKHSQMYCVGGGLL